MTESSQYSTSVNGNYCAVYSERRHWKVHVWLSICFDLCDLSRWLLEVLMKLYSVEANGRLSDRISSRSRRKLGILAAAKFSLSTDEIGDVP